MKRLFLIRLFLRALGLLLNSILFVLGDGLTFFWYAYGVDNNICRHDYEAPQLAIQRHFAAKVQLLSDINDIFGENLHLYGFKVFRRDADGGTS